MSDSRYFAGQVPVWSKRLYNWAHSRTPWRQRRERVAMRDRRVALGKLDEFSREPLKDSDAMFHTVLVDGQWDNPNYWFRYTMLRRALGLSRAHEVGVLGSHSREKVRTSFCVLGIESILDFHANIVITEPHRAQARQLLSEIKAPEDLLKLRLPHRFPACFVYDFLLKRQRRAAVDVNDPNLPELLAQALATIEAGDSIIDQRGFDLVVLSHALGCEYAALAHAAIRRGIPVIVLYGDYGTARFFLPDATGRFVQLSQSAHG